MLALPSLAAKSECLAAGSMLDGSELVGAFEFESADWGDCAGDPPPLVCTSMLWLLFPPLPPPEPVFPALEWFVDSFWLEYSSCGGQ